VRARRFFRERQNPTAYVIGPFGEGTRDRDPGRDGLPYGAQHLIELGYTVRYSDPAASIPVKLGRAGLLIRAVHRLTNGPVLSPVLEPLRILRADLVVCMFEDNLRLLSPIVRMRRRPSVLVVCWLAEGVERLTTRERRRWRRRLTAFSGVAVFSANQVELLQCALGLQPGTVRSVPFGVHMPPADAGPPVPGSVVAVGSDRGRDFGTFVDALRDHPAPVTIVTNSVLARSISDPGGIRVIGPIDHAEYLAELRRAEVVVSPTHQFAYPTGQTVVLEAMAVGKPCVVTRSAALDDYVTDGVDVLLVPPHDPAELRHTIDKLIGDEDLRRSLAAGARLTAARFSERAMWSAIMECARS
jgi:hypothetical protein